jgi:tetratricopeptide (TPR) repeat protein
MMLNPRQAHGAIAGVMLLVLSAPAAAQDILRSRLVAPAEPLTYFDSTREGIRLLDEQKYPEAAEILQKAVSQYPKDGFVWIRLGQALRLSGKPKEAIAAYEKGLELTSAWPPAGVRLSLAQSYLAVGNKDMAYRTLERVVQEDQYTQKPALYDNPAFAAIRDEPRFQKLVGRIDTSKMSREEGWRTDIDYLVSEIKRVDHLYRKQPLPAELTARQLALKRDVGKLTDEEIYLGLGRMLSPLKQGHVSLGILPETTRLTVRNDPVTVLCFSGRHLSSCEATRRTPIWSGRSAQDRGRAARRDPEADRGACIDRERDEDALGRDASSRLDPGAARAGRLEARAR